MFPRLICLSLLVLGAACRRSSEALPAPHPRFAAWNRQQARAWRPVRSADGPTIWTDAPGEADVLLAEYRHALSVLAAALPEAPSLPPPSLYLFSNAADFQAVVGVAESGLHRGASEPGHIFLLAAKAMDHGNALAHEMAHQALQASYPELPLWLEEGWVLWIAEASARDLAAKRVSLWQAPAYRLSADAVLPDLPVWEFPEYPTDRNRLIAFYDRSRELVRFLRPRFGDAEWIAWLRRVSLVGVEIALKESGWSDEAVGDVVAKARLSSTDSTQVRR